MWRFQLLFQSRIQKKNLNKWHEIARNMKLWVRGTWNIYNLFGYWGTWRATLACKSFFLSIPLLVFFYPYLSSCRSPMKRMASCVYYLAGKLPKTPFHSFAQMKRENDAIVEAKGVQCLLRTKSQLNRRRMCVCVCYGQQFSAVFSSLSFSVWWCLWTLNRISLNFKWIVLIYGYCC